MTNHRTTVSAALAVAALAAVTMGSPAAAADYTIEVRADYTQTMPSEKNSQFICPVNQVLTGRRHVGNENAPTTYYCGTIYINGQQVFVYSGDWTQPRKESEGYIVAPADQVLVGRWHEKDENGPTRYRTAALYWQNRQVKVTGPIWSDQYKESSHTSMAPSNQVMTGRVHNGDENGKTQYQYSKLVFTD
ncbi:hypothetical protein [Streptosporangium sp. NPDC023615]|uniref:hypothetical protein n=1 Tax=Streptosporangium sp. NPDC023615 TaxID=3154794 RepID=UPI00341C28BC